MEQDLFCYKKLHLQHVFYLNCILLKLQPNVISAQINGTPHTGECERLTGSCSLSRRLDGMNHTYRHSVACLEVWDWRLRTVRPGRFLEKGRSWWRRQSEFWRRSWTVTLVISTVHVPQGGQLGWRRRGRRGRRGWPISALQSHV